MVNPNPIFTAFNQLAFVGPDFRKLAKVMADEYKIGPWHIGNTDPDQIPPVAITDVTLNDEYLGTYQVAIFMCDFFPSIQLEPIQPLGGTKSIFQEYMEKHTIGVQHLCINNANGDYDRCFEAFRAQGVTGYQSAIVAGFEHCGFADHDDLLGLSLEVHDRFKEPDGPPPEGGEMYPADGKAPEGTPLATDISGIGFAVRDADRIADMFESYGVGPWEVKELPADKDNTYPIKYAVAQTGNLLLELIQPMGQDYFAEELEKYGPRVHHITFKRTGSYEETLERIRRAGFKDMETVKINGRERTYCDHQSIMGTNIEILK